MSLPHQDPDFADLLRVVADDQGLSNALVEKDYWVTHSLWAIHQTGLDIWFKGGTSLCKGFGLITRFSEDLDLKIEPGSASDVPLVGNWKSTNKGQVAQRQAFFTVLERTIVIQDARVHLDREQTDKHARGARYRVVYPGHFVEELGPNFRPFVLLEVGTARVTPFVTRSLTSFIHDWLHKKSHATNYADNRPTTVRCVHPLVTLLEKIDAIVRRYPRNEDPASFIRHYEDAAHIIREQRRLPDLGVSLAVLIEEMTDQKQIASLPGGDDPAFMLDSPQRRADLQRAHDAIAPMFWGTRISLDEACDTIRSWLRSKPDHDDVPSR